MEGRKIKPESTSLYSLFQKKTTKGFFCLGDGVIHLHNQGREWGGGMGKRGC